MNPIDQVWPQIRKMDADLIREMKNSVANYKKRFLNFPSKEIKSLGEIDFFEIIEEAYTNLAMFPDKSTLNKFREIGFNTIFLRWFISLADILTEFRRIEKAVNIKVIRPFAIGVIKLHLAVKIKYELFQWKGYVTMHKKNLEASELYVSLLSLYKQRQTIRKKPRTYKDLYTKLMDLTLDKIDMSMKDIYEPEKFMKNLSRGKSEAYFLKELAECFLLDDRVSRRQLYIEIYDLLRLLVGGDYPMLTYAEFKEKKKKKEYKIFWDTYRYRRVEQIINRK